MYLHTSHLRRALDPQRRCCSPTLVSVEQTDGLRPALPVIKPAVCSIGLLCQLLR